MARRLILVLLAASATNSSSVVRTTASLRSSAFAARRLARATANVNKELIIDFDGGVHSGGVGLGVIVWSHADSWDVLAKRRDFRAVVSEGDGESGVSSLEAAYMAMELALTTALRFVESHPWLAEQSWHFRGDSAQLVSQLNDHAHVPASMSDLHGRIQEALAKIKHFTLSHVPRRENVEAIELAEDAVRERTCSSWTATAEHFAWTATAEHVTAM
ncbi:hypothetical protein T492DRAFT_1088301 [Pavlovales sp. CCMP2436]|nr:hypothetical protein T492DRAFT_1088301 [Pavlovales sp. CCMP2436]|mmetsp:Transcript_44108/g.109216  ORF Transcript_44108/g.109216 Transcript_44108/m.109216 type:complete len:217 (+) Transcript_44108:108-758(+)